MNIVEIPAGFYNTKCQIRFKLIKSHSTSIESNFLLDTLLKGHRLNILYAYINTLKLN